MKYLWHCILNNVTSLWAIYHTKQLLRRCVYFSFKVFLSEFVMKFPVCYSPRHPIWEFPIIILPAGDFYNREMSLEIFFYHFSARISIQYSPIRILYCSSYIKIVFRWLLKIVYHLSESLLNILSWDFWSHDFLFCQRIYC